MQQARQALQVQPGLQAQLHLLKSQPMAISGNILPLGNMDMSGQTPQFHNPYASLPPLSGLGLGGLGSSFFRY
jgi:hypothetical protein